MRTRVCLALLLLVLPCSLAAQAQTLPSNACLVPGQMVEKFPDR